MLSGSLERERTAINMWLTNNDARTFLLLDIFLAGRSCYSHRFLFHSASIILSPLMLGLYLALLIQWTNTYSVIVCQFLEKTYLTFTIAVMLYGIVFLSWINLFYVLWPLIWWQTACHESWSSFSLFNIFHLSSCLFMMYDKTRFTSVFFCYFYVWIKLMTENLGFVAGMATLY